jgi:bacterioferritin
VRTDPSINKQLNAMLQQSLTATIQYFLHSRMLGNWGLRKMEKNEYDASIRAMRQADVVIGRILFLDGLPNLQDLGKLLIGESVPEVLANDLAMEHRYRDALTVAINHFEDQEDDISRHHLEERQGAIEGRIDWIEIQFSLIESMGIENYLEASIGD